MQEEVHRLQEMKALEKVCFDTTGGNPGNVRDVSGTEADYKCLTTKFVSDWRWHEVSGIKQWVRRARLVAREYRTTDGRTDCFSPATSSSILKILPVMAVNAKKSLVTLDFKDAFLLVDQIELVACRFPAEFIELMGISQDDAKKFAWILWKVLPGQRNAAALWANHLASDLVSLNFSRCPLAPSMYKDKDGTLLIVHVDDVRGMGNEARLRNLVASLKKKYGVSLEGPFLLGADYARGYSLDTIKFLKRKFSYFNHRLSICIDPKYIQKLEELFSLSHRKPKAAPCGNDILKVDPNPVHGAEDHRKYRTAIGILLYISGDRPDIQFAVNVLSSGLTAPTKRQQKQLEHLILYLTGTRIFTMCSQERLSVQAF